VARAISSRNDGAPDTTSAAPLGIDRANRTTAIEAIERRVALQSSQIA
jgi:hypothetical protein